MAGDSSADLLGYWSLDENGGTIAADSSGNGHDGTVIGAEWTGGIMGSALDFDGVDDYVLCAERTGNGPGIYPEQLMPQTFTVACWTKLYNFAYFSSFVGNGMDTGDDECGFFLYNWGWVDENEQDFGLAIRTETGMSYVETPNIYETDTWYHLAATYDGTDVRIYVDGSLAAGPTNVGGPLRWISAGSGNYPERFAIGVWLDPGYDLWIDGVIDEVGYWDGVLTELEIKRLAGRTKASEPNPADGAMYPDTWVNLSWVPGVYAVSHDVYFGDIFDDVNEGSAEVFRGNQTSPFYVVGFPGFAFPDGLVPGTTYYWRIDEVNDSDPNSPWRGNIWRFTVPPKKAYEPDPANGAKFVDPEPTLGWTEGFGAKLHTVYFGDNFDEVNDATGGLAQGTTTFVPAGPLEPEKTYYWRVDEFDAVETYRGDVWTFEVAKQGGGVKGEYFKGVSFNSRVLTRTDPQIDFNWGSGEPDQIVGADNFSVRWTGEVEAAFSETYTFYTNSDDGVRLWVDGRRLVNNWTDHSNTEDSGTIDLLAGRTYSLVMELYEAEGGALGQLRWESPSTAKQLIPQAALSHLEMAHTPKPANGTVGVNLMSTLTWRPGDSAASHDVYFGPDAEAVANATKASPEYKGNKALGDEILDAGKLSFDTRYFWRIDEVNDSNPDSPWTGNVWGFSTGPFLLVDDFETYDDIDPAPGELGINRIFDKWIDGFGSATNGALVGNDLPPYAEQTVVHGGTQSLVYRYDNADKTSEATLTLVYPRDWTEQDVTKLSLWFYGDSANAADQMFVALNDTAVVYHDDTAATQLSGWSEWVIDLTEFGIDMTNVDSITIGIGTRNAPAPTGGAGTMYFDDIRLIR
ncbi:MAG: PA14 domain-containing protein [Planctomycetota bacterium]